MPGTNQEDRVSGGIKFNGIGVKPKKLTISSWQTQSWTKGHR